MFKNFVLIIILCAVLVGCATPPVKFDPTTDIKSFNNPQKHQIYSLSPLAINIDKRFFSLSEEETFFGYKNKFEIGNLFQRVFKHSPKSNIQIELVASNLNVLAQDYLNSSASNISYEMTVRMKNGDKSQLLTIIGMGGSDSLFDLAGKRAVEDAVYKLYKIVEENRI